MNNFQPDRKTPAINFVSAFMAMVASKIAALTLTDVSAIVGICVGLFGAAYTARRWYLMEKCKRSMTSTPFNEKNHKTTK